MLLEHHCRCRHPPHHACAHPPHHACACACALPPHPLGARRRYNVPALADEGYHVFALDLLGFGLSEKVRCLPTRSAVILRLDGPMQ